MREFRFLVPTTTVILSWISASYLYGKTEIFNLGKYDYPLLQLAIAGFISWPAIGFLISQVSVFAINICDLLVLPFFDYCRENYKKPLFFHSKFIIKMLKQFCLCKSRCTKGTFYFTDVDNKLSLVEKEFSFKQIRSTREINARLWFAENISLKNGELSAWLERRWAAIMSNLNTIVALAFTLIIFTNYYHINVLKTERYVFCVYTGIGIVLFFNLVKAWADVRLVESYFFENISKIKQSENDKCSSGYLEK